MTLVLATCTMVHDSAQSRASSRSSQHHVHLNPLGLYQPSHQHAAWSHESENLVPKFDETGIKSEINFSIGHLRDGMRGVDVDTYRLRTFRRHLCHVASPNRNCVQCNQRGSLLFLRWLSHGLASQGDGDRSGRFPLRVTHYRNILIQRGTNFKPDQRSFRSINQGAIPIGNATQENIQRLGLKGEKKPGCD